MNNSYFRWLPVLFIWTFILCAYCVYVIVFCFGIIELFEVRLALLVPFHVLFFLFLWTMVQTMIAPNEGPPDNFNIPAQIDEELKAISRSRAYNTKEFYAILERYVMDQKIEVACRAQNGAIRFCTRCACIKPDRCHHCSTCGRCFLKYDHHCPWINVCIRFNNYKFFVQFVGYAWLLSVFIFSTIFPFFITFWDAKISNVCRILVTFLFVLMFLLGLSLTFFLTCHLYLISKNRTSLEVIVGPPVFTYGEDKHAFDLGIRRNFQEVFGTVKWKWFFPLFSSQGDAVRFERREEVQAVAEEICE
ncbi:hypothetical protein niasHT_007052 [Heterodera trifolii]|uniref:Palmitoyltransferase n=1 Tax=Heterodera trifolii TaxID=157864 RepID=A0ABD2LXJ0_9BILA